MRLELGSFPVIDIAFGSETAWKDGVLEVDRDSPLGPGSRKAGRRGRNA